MTDEKIREVLDRYEQTLQALAPFASDWQDKELAHLLTMIPKMRDMLADERYIWDAEQPSWQYHANREKVMRWLGFMQGAFWVKGIYTIDELKAHNRPDDGTHA